MKANERPETVAAAKKAAVALVAKHKDVIAHAARELDVPPSALWQLVRKDRLLPSLARRMEDLGIIHLTAVRHRRCAEFSSEERAGLFDDMMRERGETLSQWMNEELDIWLKTS